ncbi:MAG: response regulator transcription factor [Deltaproteobacteria bacterium]|nr:response regulator transcription factor [Deltaproteobacteria bacterium]
MRILVVEDEKRLAEFIKNGLREQKYSVDVAFDGEEGEYNAMTNDYDLIILDILLPKKNGWEVCESLRNAGVEIPIIILSALSDVSDRIRGLEKGADDYLTKPFVIAELVARVNALLRRAHKISQPVIRIRDLELDTAARKVKRAGEDIQLTNKEFALLEYLIMNKNKVVTRTMISEHVWDIHFDAGSNVIDVIINFLRKKIDVEGEGKLIHTIRGSGYMLKDEETGQEDMT